MIADSTVRSMCTIGQEISIWCEKNHIINQELADALAVSRETVKRIKNGTRELTSKEIRKLSVLMEKQADFFIVRAKPCLPLCSFSLIRKTELWETNKPPAMQVS